MYMKLLKAKPMMHLIRKLYEENIRENFHFVVIKERLRSETL